MGCKIDFESFPLDYPGQHVHRDFGSKQRRSSQGDYLSGFLHALIAEHFPWDDVMEFDVKFRELLSSGAHVELIMTFILTLFMMQF